MTPVHDHQVWGLVGMLRGSETSQHFVLDPARRCARQGQPRHPGAGRGRGAVAGQGDIHQVTNARSDGNSISIHVYGGNIGAMRRRRFDPATGAVSEFVSGYTNREMPNLWDG